MDLDLKLPAEEVELGVPFEIELGLANNSANTLKNVRIELQLPENILLVDKPDEKIVFRSIGDVVNGRLERETYRVVAVPGENPNYRIKSVVYYVPASISASLQKGKEASARVRSPDSSLELTLPEQIFSSEELEARAAYKNSLEPKDGNYSLELVINYPPEFQVSSRDPEPKGENMSWRLDDLGLREGVAALKGDIELSDEASFSLTAKLVMRILGKEYPVISNTKNISINPSPLAFRVSLVNPRETVEPGEELTYLLQYRNNTNVPLEDAIISAALKGDMFDVATLETNGAADLLNQALIWSPSQIKELEILDPGEGGQVSFAVKVKGSYPGGNENQVLRVNARIESPTVPPPLNLKKTVNLSSLETKVAPPGSQ